MILVLMIMMVVCIEIAAIETRTSLCAKLVVVVARPFRSLQGSHTLLSSAIISSSSTTTNDTLEAVLEPLDCLRLIDSV